MNSKLITPMNLMLSIIYMLFIISFAVVVTLNFRPLYYMDIQHLDIAETSGIPEEEIKENYDVLIDYNSMFYQGELQFPSLTMSESGKIHFEEVKDIFVAVQYLLIITILLGAGGTILQLKKKQYGFLKLASILTLIVPVILGILIMLNWDNFFVTFHQLFFQNEYWIFDAALDPVITILPDTFFMHCAIMIIGCVFAGSILCYGIFAYLKHRLQIKAESDKSDSGTL